MRNNIISIAFIGTLLIAVISISCTISSPNKQGENLYKQHCSTCHGDEGQGLRKLYPPIANADYLKLYRDELSCLIKNGITTPIMVNGIDYHMPMPPNPQLNAVEIHNILNFICNSWGNDLGYFTPNEVENQLKNCQ